MNKCAIFFLFLFLYGSILAQNKSHFDVLSQGKVNESLQKSYRDKFILSNMYSEFTMMNGGYFTIGTTFGLDPSSIDDSCQVSYGHPYALTSYPVIILDGEEFKPEILFYNGPQEISIDGDTIKYQANNSLLSVSFKIAQLNNGQRIKLDFQVKNNDVTSHNIRSGFYFDPALGNWGDGNLFLSSTLVENEMVLENSEVLPQLAIWERDSNNRGLGIQLDFADALPETVYAGNWRDLKDGVNTLSDKLLYDLYMKILWSEVEVTPGSSTGFSMEFDMFSPEFQGDVFTRWDLPQNFSIEQNILFPLLSSSIVKLINPGGMLTECDIMISGNNLIDDWETPVSFNIDGMSSTFQLANVVAHETFSPEIKEVTLNIMQGEVMIDQITRRIYLPASPFSDSGLNVEIDTLLTGNFPDINIKFQVNKEETGQFLTSIMTENVFLFEDLSRINNFILEKDTNGYVNELDLIFVLDVTGSMGNEIAGVRDNIIEFTDSLVARDIDFRLGMVTFLDAIENIYGFTSDAALFQQYVAQQYAHGGGDYPENSLDALMATAQFPFRSSAQRVIIWITDASYHINNHHTSLTQEDVVNELLSLGIKIHCIGNLNEQVQYYEPIVFPTGGDIFDINGNFRDILLEISNFAENRNYQIFYTTQLTEHGFHQINLEVHYAGLGGSDTTGFNFQQMQLGMNNLPRIRCHPNPFNPETVISLSNLNEHKGRIDIYNILGQKIKSYRFAAGNHIINFKWNAEDDSGRKVSNGLYLINVQLFDSQNRMKYTNNKKILYLK